MLRRFEAARWPLLAAAAAALVPTVVLVAGYSLSWRDTAQLMGPLRPAIVEALRDLRIPGWNPWEGAGQPLFGQFLNGVLHPVSVLLAPFTASIDALIVALVAAAAAGAWLAARVLGSSREAAVAAGLAYGLSGFVLGMSSNTQYLMSAATGPWAVAGLVVAAGRPRRLIPGALAVGALTFAGDPGGVAAFSLAGAALAVRVGGFRALGAVAVSGVLGLALAAVQLLPAAIHIADTTRGHGLLEEIDLRAWSLVPWRLLELAAPGFFVGRPTSYVAPVFAALDGTGTHPFPFVPSVFVGAATLVLAAVGAVRTARARWLAVLALTFVWLALGHRLGSQQLLAWVPVWGTLRYWEKMVAPLTLCLALAAASGVDELAGGGARTVRRMALAALGASVALLGLFVSSAGPALLGLPGGTVAALAATRLEIGLLHAAAGLVGLAGTGWLAERHPGLAARAAVALVFVQSAAASPFALHASDRAALSSRPPELPAEAPGPRVAAPLGCDFPQGQDDLDPIDLLNLCERRVGRPSTNAGSRTDAFQAYSALTGSRWNAVIGSGPHFWAIARRLGTTHVLSRQPRTRLERTLLEAAVRGAGPPALLDGGALLAWSLPHRPWASFATEVRSASDAREAVRELVREIDRGGPAVVVETPEAFGPLAPGRVVSVDRRPDEAVIVAESAGDGLLVVNDAWEEGWRAWVDGREVGILPADVLVRAIPWPGGRHELRMRYRPPGLRLGAAITLVGLLVMAGLAVAERRRRGAPS